MATSKAANK